MASSSAPENSIPLNTLLHMLTIKLSSSNYLLWKNQMIPILSYQNLLRHVDGSSVAPAASLSQPDGKTINNPDYTTWVTDDQKTTIILHASLSEEAISVIVGLLTARDIWVVLESAFGNSSIERVHNLRDQLRQSTKGSKSVAEFGRFFKGLCDQLAAIGHPVDVDDQLHWFLCGLGSTFETFSTAIRSSRPTPLFADLLARAESHELFLQALHGSSPPTVAFSATVSSASRGRGGRFSRGGRGRGRRPPHCQLCRTNGHYASACPKLASYASQANQPDDALASSFLSQCHVSSSELDCFVDSGATDHMTASPDTVIASPVAPVSALVTFGNGHCLPISHKGHAILS